MEQERKWVDGLVSVVIPVYNAADVIERTIDTVFGQTYADWELVVIDDGSTDGSGEVIRRHTGRLRLVQQENRGVACARNRGIAMGRGEFVALLDHDDLWHPTKLEKQVAVLNARREVGMVVTDVAHIDRQGVPMGIVGAGYNPKETFARLFVRGYVPTPSAALIRASVFRAVGGFDETFRSAGLDDHELWTRIASHAELANVAEPLTFHRNRTHQPQHIAIEHRAVLIPKLLDRFGRDPEKRRYLAREQALYLADRGKQLVRAGRRREGRTCLTQGALIGLAKAHSAGAAWRCLLRWIRSYL